MSLEERIDALRNKHRHLDRVIEREENRPHPDDVELHALKKRKLRIKDEIAALTTH